MWEGVTVVRKCDRSCFFWFFCQLVGRCDGHGEK